MPLEDLDRVADQAATPHASCVVTNEHEQRQRKHEVDVRGRRFQQFLRSGRVAVLHREHRYPVADQDEYEQRDRQGQHERGNFHTDRLLDLTAHLDGDGFPEQLHPAGHPRRGHLGLQEERQADGDDSRDRGGEHRVGVDGHTQPRGRGVVADLDSALGEDPFGHVVNP